MTESQTNPPLVVVPAQRLDSSTSPAFERELMAQIEQGATTVLLDFASVNYISSAGLRVILLAGKRLKASGGSLGLCGLNDDCREVFRISGFDALFPLHASVDEALGR